MFQKNRFLLVLLFAVQSLFAQIPQGFNYQATVRNQTGELLTNEYVGIRFHIVQGTEQNNPVYSEFHYESTDDLGSLHLMIGQGTVEAGAFNQIDWSLGDYHMGIEINTGSGFIDMGTTQLMSVPFALYALNSGTTNSASLPQGNTVGDVLSWNGSTWTVATSNGSTNLPEINTQEASDIKGSSARVEGEFWLDGSSSITAKGVVWSEDPIPTVALPTKTDEGPGATNFESQLIGLSPNTTYHYRGYATNAAGTFYGDEQTFTTGEGVVALTTSLVVRDPFPEMSESMMSDGGAGSGGNISDDGGAAIAARGVCWSTLANPTIADSKTEDGTGAGSFSSRLNGLVWNTTYYLRSYATNATGTFYGNEQRFTYPLPYVGLSIGAYAAESVPIGAYFYNFEENSIITSGVCWSTSAHPTIADNKQENNMGTDEFDITLTELAADTTYYLRSYATTEMGTYYSNEVVFSWPLHGGILTGPDTNDFFNTQEDYESALDDTYHMLRVTFWNVLAATIASDDVIAGGDPQYYDQPTLQRIDKMDQTPADNNQISDIWGFMYEAMDKANYILEFQDKTAFEGKQEVIAQAYFLRAYFAFELTKFFGDIPLLLNEAGTRIQNKRIYTADPYAVSRVGSKSKVYELIEADLEEAIELGLPTSLTNINEKYITEHAAQALLGKVYLYHGSDDASKFSKAATELNKVIESSKYSLVSAYDNIFSNDNENNAESVFEIQYVSTEGASWDCIQCSEGNYLPQNNAPRDYSGPIYKYGWGFGLPTQQLYDAFASGDSRRDATLFEPNANDYTVSRENTGYFCKKYLPTQANEVTRAGSDPLNYENNYRAIRFADVLLMAAEAEAQIGGNKAVPYLNMVRARAFGDNSHDYPYNGETDLLEAIYKERRLELATEGHRYFDLVRTGKAKEAYEAYNTAISGNGDFEIITFETTKNEVFPIPFRELSLSNAVDRWGQNPGYSMNDSGGDNGGGTDPVGGTITGVDFTIAELNGDGNEVGVTPTSTGGTNYSIDFGDGSPAVTTPGTQKSHTYAAESATYTIEVTASADGAENVVKSKDYTITYEAPNVIANFEADAEVGNIFDTSGDLGISVEDASADASSYGKVGKIVYAEEYYGWNRATLSFGKYIDLSENSVITMDIYNAEAAVVPVTMKLEGVTGNDELKAWNKIEVEVNTEAVAGWQTLTFDFADARMSGDGSGTGGLILDGPSYGQMVLFIGVTIMDGTSLIGTYEVDNIQGAGWGATIDIADTDGDGITDADDACPNEAPEEGKDSNKDGCNDTPTGSTSNVSDDMEGDSTLTWAPDASTLEIIDNPYSGAGNTSAKVVKYVDPGTGSPYSNIRFDLAADHSLKFDLTTKNVFTVNVYVPTPATPVTENLNLALKLQDGSAARPWEGQFVVDQTYVYDQWQTLTFDFSSQAAETKYSRILIQFNGEGNEEPVEAAYIDDILLQ